MKLEIFVGRVGIGGRHPISIQSMTSTPARQVRATLNQISKLQEAGCDIVRVGLPGADDLAAFKKIVEHSVLPLIADIHFDADLALKAIEAGAQGLRINPGNIGGKNRLREIVKLARERQIPIRIGVNAGSLEKRFRHTKQSTAQKMVDSALEHIRFIEDCDFSLLKISLKSSTVSQTVEAYRLINKLCDYPLHLGITEAGTFFQGTVKSAVGIGSLLLDGIGNTIRVSLTEDPQLEVRVAKEILKVLDLRQGGIEIISCPTCSRTTVDLIKKVKEFERRTAGLGVKKKLKVAIMGCEVNGPGEAMEADIGLAFSKNRGFLFKKRKIIKSVKAADAIGCLIDLIAIQEAQF